MECSPERKMITVENRRLPSLRDGCRANRKLFGPKSALGEVSLDWYWETRLWSSTADFPDCRRPGSYHRTLIFWASELTAIRWRPDHAQCEKLLATCRSKWLSFCSIPTAPTNHLPDWSGLSKNATGQNGADNPDDPVRA